MKRKLLYYIELIIVFSSLFILLNYYNYCFGASTPKLVNTMEKAFESIESWLIKLSTPMAAVAVVSGLFMQKFSFGDEERIRTGKKLIRTSIVSYAFILLLDMLINLIDVLVG